MTFSHPLAAEDTESAAFLRVAEEVARAAGKNILEATSTTRLVEKTKSNNADLLTILDPQNEAQIMATISERFPTHLFIAEETKADLSLTAAPTWLIDPIDGTTNFVHSYHECCVSVALAIDQMVVVAAVFNPATNTMFSAVKGHGSYCNGNAMRVSQCSSVDTALLSTNINSCKSQQMTEANLGALRAFLAARCHGYRMCGSAALNMSYVADGRLDAYFEIEVGGIWDVAAGQLLITEAGGAVLDILGGPFELKAGKQYVLCGNPTLLPLLSPVTRAAFAFTQNRFATLKPSTATFHLQQQQQPSPHFLSICNYFQVEAASKIKWAHAVNDEPLLAQALAEGKVHMLEIDIAMRGNTPVMSHDRHPPAGAMTFHDWLTRFLSKAEDGRNGHLFEECHFNRPTWCSVCQGFFDSSVGKQGLKCVRCPVVVHKGPCLNVAAEPRTRCTQSGKMRMGLKLDFKVLEAAVPCLALLEARRLTIPVWINADIIAGPSNPTDPFTANSEVVSSFLNLCCEKQKCGYVCSLGWMTGTGTELYTDEMVARMLSICQQFELTEVTFPVKASLVSASHKQMQELLARLPTSSLTVWTSRDSGISASAAEGIQKAFEARRLFVDAHITET